MAVGIKKGGEADKLIQQSKIKQSSKNNPNNDNKRQQNRGKAFGNFGFKDKNIAPYACFYDENTILTKNGELLQIIKFANFTHDETPQDNFDLRLAIRNAISNNLSNKDFSFWIHTIRREKEIEWQATKERDTFEYILHKNWRRENKFDGAFVNEVYLTILIRGVDYPLFNIKTMFSFFSKKFLERSFYGFIKKQHNKLNDFIDKVLEDSKTFIPKRLSFYKKDDDFYYSEKLEFLDKIINLINVPSIVPISDLSDFLGISKYRIGFNNISIQNTAKKNVVALFSIKDYQEISVNLVSELTSLNIELIIYQTFDSIKSPLARQHYQNASRVFKISKDEEFFERSGIKDVVESKWHNSHFGEHQISVAIYASNEIELNKRVDLFVKTLSNVGFCMVREDLFNEDVLYGIIPANYEFLKRKKFTHISRFGAFAITANYPSGNANPPKWKMPITAFSTIKKTPYFFNFHHSEESSGHTLILGPKGSGASVLSNFLISESLKIKPKVISLCVDNGSDLFFTEIGGIAKTVSTKPIQNLFKINPFSLLHSKHERVAKVFDENIAFIKQYTQQLMEYKATPLTKNEKLDLDNAIKLLQKNSLKVFNIKDFLSFLKEPTSLKRLQRFTSSGYSFLFSADDDFEDFNAIMSINIAQIISDVKLFSIVFDYIFYRIDLTLNGEPMIIKLDDVMELFATERFQPGVFKGWLTKIAKYNAVCLVNLDTDNVSYLEKYISSSFFHDVDSVFFMPEKLVLKGNVLSSIEDYDREKELKRFYKETLSLSNKDIDIIFSLSKMDERHIMLKHNNVDCILKFDLSNIPHILLFLSSPNEFYELFKSIRQSEPTATFRDIFQKFCLEVGIKIDNDSMLIT